MERVYDVVRARPELSVSRAHAAPVERALQELRGRYLQLLRFVYQRDDSAPAGRAGANHDDRSSNHDDAGRADDHDAKPDPEPDDADDDNAKPDAEPYEAGNDDAVAGRRGLWAVGTVERLLGNLRRDRAALPVSRAHAAAVECRMSELRARAVQRNRPMQPFDDASSLACAYSSHSAVLEEHYDTSTDAKSD